MTSHNVVMPIHKMTKYSQPQELHWHSVYCMMYMVLHNDDITSQLHMTVNNIVPSYNSLRMEMLLTNITITLTNLLEDILECHQISHTVLIIRASRCMIVEPNSFN